MTHDECDNIQDSSQGSRSRSRNYNYELCYDVICDLR